MGIGGYYITVYSGSEEEEGGEEHETDGEDGLVDYIAKVLNVQFNLNKFEFVEVFKGQHFYKESDYHKSNVFSLAIRNSGLEDGLYTYDELEKISNGFDWSKLSGKYGMLFDQGDIIEGHKPDYRNCKFFKYDDGDRESQSKLMESKMKLRAMFEEAVRKSIYRYVPAGTTLWKIEYES